MGTITGKILFAGQHATKTFLRRYTGYVEQFGRSFQPSGSQCTCRLEAMSGIYGLVFYRGVGGGMVPLACMVGSPY